MKQVKAASSSRFSYVTLVCNKNSLAYQRGREFNFKWYPTVFHDGGYRVDVGASSSAYSTSLALSEQRSVHPLDLDLEMAWQGKGQVQVTAKVKNRGAGSFSGRLRVYMVEPVSTQGWRDRGNNPYTNAFLAYAINQAISVGGQKTATYQASWSGPMAGYTNLTYDNILAIGAVFSGTPVTAYADPPSGNPFKAYYAQTCVEARPLTLGASTSVIFASWGGAVDFHCCGYPARASGYYLVLGSMAGTSPGLPLPGTAHLPLNYDFFMGIMVGMINTPLATNFAGRLDSKGYARATLTIPALPGALGLSMDFAWIDHNTFNFSSNPVRITFQ